MRQIDSKNLMDAIEAIYESVGQQTDFAKGLAVTGSQLGSFRVLLSRLALAGIDDLVIAEHGLGDQACREILEARDRRGNFLAYSRGWDQDNVYDSERLGVSAVPAVMGRKGSIAGCTNLDYAVAGVIGRNQSNCVVLTCYRSSIDGHFTDTDRKTLRQLLPHWRRALELQQQIDSINMQSHATNRILDHAPFSILIVDSAAHILYENYMSKVANHAGGGLVISDGQLRFDDPDVRKKFFELLADAERLRKESGGVSPVMMAVDRPSAAKPYQVMVLPVQRGEGATFSIGSTYGVFIYDPMVYLPVNAEALCELEGLTQAEAKLCKSLYSTKSLGETARQLDVSISTAKTHLLNTFRKLGINSQTELMQYLAHMPKTSGEPKH